MATAKKLEVTITYKVGLGGVKMPKKVLEQLIEASENSDELGSDTRDKEGYSEATEWLIDNIGEKDCYDWNCQIEEIE